MDNVTVDGFEMRHLSDGFSSNSLYRERKIALELMSPHEYGGKQENVGRRNRDNETKAKNCLRYRRRTRKGRR